MARNASCVAELGVAMRGGGGFSLPSEESIRRKYMVTPFYAEQNAGKDT
jgi:hypothetical protein